MRAFACGLLLAVTAALADGQDCAVLERQMNQRAGQLARACHPAQAPAPPGEPELLPPAFPPLLGTTDRDVILGGEGVYPHVTQSETQAAMSGATRVIAYNDSSNAGASPRCYAGGSVSRDSGATWTKLPAAAFCSGGHGNNFGDPFVLHDNRHTVWVAGFIVSGGCGAQGLGAWRSGDGVTWTVGSCVHSGSNDDRETAAVDNSATSQFFGRIYVVWNDFSFGGSVFTTHSDDGGVSWSTAVQVTTGFFRDVQMTTDAVGHVVIALMDEGNGGLDCRQNWFAHSSDGGQTWAVAPTGNRFTPSGRFTCGYFGAAFPNYWREEGGGDFGGAQGILHYVFASGQVDASDVFYIRSTDGGASWSPPIRLNSDTSGRLQWQPSIAVSPAGHVLVSWYDQRQTTGTSYERWGRLSTDNGLTWGPDQAISDAPSPLPAQVDGSVQPCYAGDYDRGAGDGSTFTVPWVDGRTAINGVAQQDVWTDSVTDTATSGSTLPTVNLACVTTSTIATTTTTTIPGAGCTSITPIPPQGGTVTSSTSGNSALSGSCGGGNAPEQVFSWTPSASGVATITTCGGATSYDTLLYVRQGSCATGVEVACNDDAGCSPTLASRVAPTVTAGTTYYIVVDGFATSSGTFTLTVTPPGAGTTTTTVRSTTTTSTSTTSTTFDPCVRNPHPRRCRARLVAG